MNLQDLLTSVIRKPILGLTAYKVADANNLIKLDAMENPYRWPASLVDEWLEQLRDVELNRYPDPSAKTLAETLTRYYQFPTGAEVLLGNGSDELIQLLLMALPTGSKVLVPEPAFVMYKQVSVSLELKFIGASLNPETFDLDLPAMLNAIEEHHPKLIFIAYPNNPTGNLFNRDAINAIIQRAPGLVIIDEAYEPFANATYLAELPKYPNLLVMRTISKMGLAGLRLGYLVGNSALIEQLNKVRLPYNINSLTQVSANFALSNRELFDQQTTAICTERERVLNELSQIKTLHAYPSAANFILFRAPGNADAIFNDLKRQGILIKNLNPQGGLLHDCLRVTIGTPEENRLFLEALKNSLSSL